jgi:hypothetical protein
MQQVMTPEGAAEFIARYNTLVCLVTDMRKAQKNYYKEKAIIGRKVAYQNMINKEYKVDQFLGNMED